MKRTIISDRISSIPVIDLLLCRTNANNSYDAISTTTTSSNNGNTTTPTITTTTTTEEEGKTVNSEQYDDEISSCIAQQLIEAFQTIGFVIIINHSIDNQLITNAFNASTEFFTTLSNETKLKYKYRNYQSNRGYIPFGSEHHENSAIPDFKETYDIGIDIDNNNNNNDESNDVSTETPWPEPQDIPDEHFRTILTEYYYQMNQLNLYIMKLIGIGLQLPDPNYLVDRCNEQHCNLRLLHYPELQRQDYLIQQQSSLENENENYDPQQSTTITTSATSEPIIIQRGAEHRDYGTITLLVQDMVGGLRVKTLDGSYIFVDPIPGSIIINVGEMLQRWTNDRLIATPHQVINHPNHNGNSNENGDIIIPERYSIAFFCNPNKDVIVNPITMEPDEIPNYEPITAHDYLTKRLGSTITTN